MLLWVRHQWTLRGLIKKKRRVQKRVSKQWREAEARGMSSEEQVKLIDEIQHERMLIEEEITAAIESYLFELAYCYRVPTPSFIELELRETSPYSGREQFTEKTLTEFRKR